MRANSRGFSLVEVMLAMGIVAFAVLGIVALLPFGLGVARNSRSEIQAMNLATAMVSDLRATSLTNGSSMFFGITPLPWVPDPLSGNAMVNPALSGQSDHTYFVSEDHRLVPSAEEGAFRVSLRYTALPSSPGAAVEASLTTSWPPAVDPFSAGSSAPHGKVEFYLTVPPP